MNGKIQKYLLQNIPYLFVLWFCLKLGTTYRLADGVDFGFKLIGMSKTISSALGTVAPGLNGFDWLIGVIGAVLLRVIVYYKIKKAKKFRMDVEYGSARWEA